MSVTSKDGFSLLELMVTVVIMSILAIAVSQFSAVAFVKQADNARVAESVSQSKGALAMLQRDAALAGFGMQVGTAVMTLSNNAGENGSDILSLTGLPLAGAHQAPWSYVLQGGTGTTFWVRCFGRQQGSNLVPDPAQDLIGNTLTGTPVQAISYSGQSLSNTSLAIVANDATCSTPDIDYDGDNQRDRAQQITLNTMVSLPAGAILVARRSFDGVTAPTITYRVLNRQFTRTIAGLAPEPLLEGVEDFQVLFGVVQATSAAAVTTGTGAPQWRSAPPWNQNERLVALRVGFVLSNPTVTRGLETTHVALFDHSYALPPTMQTWERRQALLTFATHNTLLAHP